MNKTTKVTIYTSNKCPNCKQAKTYLQKHNVRFVEFNVEQNQRAFKEFHRLGARGVPVTMIGDIRVDGFQPKKLEHALKKKQLIE